MATNINNKLVCNEPHANLDSYYGPYDSVDAAFNALADTTVNGVNYTKKYIGLTVGVWNSAKTEITEYWFKGGTAKANLVVKTDGSGGGLPSGIKIVTFDKNNIILENDVYRYEEDAKVAKEIQIYNTENILTTRKLLKHDANGNLTKISTYSVSEKFGETVTELSDIIEYSYQY